MLIFMEIVFDLKKIFFGQFLKDFIKIRMQKQSLISNVPSSDEKEILCEIEEVAVKKIYDTKAQLNHQYSEIRKHEDDFYRQAYTQLEVVCRNQLQNLEDWRKNFIESTNMTFNGTSEIIERQRKAANENASQRILDYIAFKARLLMEQFPEQTEYFKKLGWESPITIPDTFMYPYRPSTDTSIGEKIMFPEYEKENRDYFDFYPNDDFEANEDYNSSETNENNFQSPNGNPQSAENSNAPDNHDNPELNGENNEEKDETITELDKGNSFENLKYIEEDSTGQFENAFNPFENPHKEEITTQSNQNESEEMNHDFKPNIEEAKTDNSTTSSFIFPNAANSVQNYEAISNPQSLLKPNSIPIFNTIINADTDNRPEKAEVPNSQEPAFLSLSNNSEQASIFKPRIKTETTNNSEHDSLNQPDKSVQPTLFPVLTRISEKRNSVDSVNNHADDSEQKSAFEQHRNAFGSVGYSDPNKSLDQMKEIEEEENNEYEIVTDQPELTAKFIMGQIKIGEIVSLNLPEGLTLVGKIDSFDSVSIKFIAEEGEEINIPVTQFEDRRYFFLPMDKEI